MTSLRAITGLSAEGVVRFGRDIFITANLGSVQTYPAMATGEPAPTRTIGGPATGFGFIYGLAVF